MAITWGAVSRYASVGIDLRYSGTTVYVDYYVRTTATSVADNQTLTCYGAVTGSVNYYMSVGNNVAKLVTTKSFTAPRGTNFSVGGSVSGIYDGSTPSHSRSGSIPSTVPNQMSIPTVTEITSTSAVVKGVAPASNGGAISAYTFQYATNSGFTSNVEEAVRTSPRHEPGRDPNTTYYVRVRAANSSGQGSWSDGTKFKTLSAEPDAPTNLTLTGNTLSWILHPTVDGPISNVQVFRNEVKIAELGAVTSYSLATSGRSENSKYEYKVRAINPNAKSAYSATVTEYTKPAPATQLAAVKDTSGNAILTWKNGAEYPVRSQVYASSNGGAWNLLGTSIAGATSFTHVSPDENLTWVYSIISLSPDSIASDRSANSNVLALLAAPLKPLLIKPVNGALVVSDEACWFQWKHQPVDFTPQTRAQVQIDSVTRGEINGDADSFSYVLAPGTHTYRVRTLGRFNEFSPYSSVYTITAAPRPVVMMATPDGRASRLILPWSVDQEIRSYSAILYQGEEALELLTGSIVEELKFSTVLDNLTGYEIVFEVVASNGIPSTPLHLDFETDFPQPPAPQVEAVFDRDRGTIYLDIQTGEPTLEQEPAETSSIWRSIDGGPKELVVEGIDPNAHIADNQATIGGLNTYYVYTYTDEETSNLTVVELTVPAPHNRCYTFLNYGPDFALFVRAKGHSFDDSQEVETQLHTFAGRTKPFPVWGEVEERACTFTTNKLKPDDSPYSQWRDMYRARAQVLYRDCTGRRIYGTITSLNHSDEHIKITVEETAL